MDYAIVEIGGHQRKVSPGDTIQVNRLDTDESGKNRSLAIERVLAVRAKDTFKIGSPLVDGASVKATVLGEARGKKVIVFKKKRRKQYRRTRGHRAELTTLRIDEIRAGN